MAVINSVKLQTSPLHPIQFKGIGTQVELLMELHSPILAHKYKTRVESTERGTYSLSYSNAVLITSVKCFIIKSGDVNSVKLFSSSLLMWKRIS
jgi:hypothetical protein